MSAFRAKRPGSGWSERTNCHVISKILKSIARIAKAALHQLPGNSSLNVRSVCPVCPLWLVGPGCLGCWPHRHYGSNALVDPGFSPCGPCGEKVRYMIKMTLCCPRWKSNRLTFLERLYYCNFESPGWVMGDVSGHRNLEVFSQVSANNSVFQC